MPAPTLKRLLLTSVLAVAGTAAQATTVTFENLAAEGFYKNYPNTTFTPGTGYALATTGTDVWVFDSTYIVANFIAANGTDYLRLKSGTSVTLTSRTNTPFSVSSVDLANYAFTNASSVYDEKAILTGTYADGSRIVTTFLQNHDNSLTVNDFATETLSGFTNLTSFTIASAGWFYLDVDNIVVSAAATDVPEPASFAIMGLGLAAIGAVRRRRSA
jgi:hypothetical protein